MQYLLAFLPTYKKSSLALNSSVYICANTQSPPPKFCAVSMNENVINLIIWLIDGRINVYLSD
jgi:hypothetical protein